MNNRENVEKLIKQGFKARMIADALYVSPAYVSMYRKGERQLSKKKEEMLTLFLNKYQNILWGLNK